jgi:hypothetical protein
MGSTSAIIPQEQIGLCNSLCMPMVHNTQNYWVFWLCPSSGILNKKFWEELIAYFSWYDTGYIENDASNNYSIVACVSVTAVTFLPSRCLAMIGGIFTESLPSSDMGDTQTHTQTAMWSHKPTLFFQNKGSRLKNGRQHNITGPVIEVSSF